MEADELREVVLAAKRMGRKVASHGRSAQVQLMVLKSVSDLGKAS